jgi:hypothetical protein
MKRSGFTVSPEELFLGLLGSQMAISRVAMRVAQGGHNVTGSKPARLFMFGRTIESLISPKSKDQQKNRSRNFERSSRLLLPVHRGPELRIE